MNIKDLLLKAHAEKRQLSGAPEPASVADVYRIQDLVYEELSKGARPVAWKVGGASADAEPTIAPILPGRLFETPAQVNAADFHMIGVEAEIAFRLLDSGDYEAVVALELCDARLADWKDASALMKLADNQLNWGLVAGSGRPGWGNIDFGGQVAELWIGGDKKVSAVGGHPYGNPFKLVSWTQRHLAKRGLGMLKPGDIVTTGSWGGMHFAKPGDEAIARFPGIGEASVKIGA